MTPSRAPVDGDYLDDAPSDHRPHEVDQEHEVILISAKFPPVRAGGRAALPNWL
jgi:hypothetical protein